MKNSNPLLVDLITATKNEMLSKDYQESVLCTNFVTFDRLLEYAAEKGIQHYSRQLVDSFMLEKYNYPEKDDCISKFRPSTIKNKLKELKKLEWMHKNSHIEKRRIKIREPLSKQWGAALSKFADQQSKRNYTDTTKFRYELTLRQFAEYMMDSGIKNLSKLSAMNISDYILTMSGNAPATIQSDLGRIRRFCKFLYLEGFTKTNFEYDVPKLSNSTPSRDSNIWSAEEFDKLLSVINRSDGTGKRDYAMILMAADLGLRVSDIIGITFDDIKWEKWSIELVQTKTKLPITLPLTERLGEAIIDYLKHARPKTDCNNIFVKLTPPYGVISSFNDRFSKYVNLAGIVKKPMRRYGIHSLRHTLSTRMLEAGIPFDVIVPMIGHYDENTLNLYLSKDIENLRKCALSFSEEVAQGV